MMLSMAKPTSDLCDEHGDLVQVLAPGLTEFGGAAAFSGVVATLQVSDDNSLVREALERPGEGRVLVVDGGRSLGSALVGGNLAKLAEANNWSGIVVWGAVRDIAEIQQCRIGVRALAACPRKSRKAGSGLRDVPVEIAGITIRSGDWIAADADGIVVSAKPL